MGGVRRSWLRNAALIGFGLVLGLCVLEGGLQLGALVLRTVSGESPATWMGLGRRVLCVGDSNTYGIWLDDRSEAYPAQLERMWNAVGDAPPIEVLNLGYPGTNTSLLRRNLPAMLETFEPDVVIVMVGANDSWTAPVAVDETAAPSGALQFLRRYSRTYQLVYMLRRAFDERRLQIDRNVKEDGGMDGAVRYGDTEFAMGFAEAPRRNEHNRELVDNLRAIIAAIHAANAEPVVMTYPSRAANYGEAGMFLRGVALESGTRLVDLAATFDAVCAKPPCPEWFYPDHHPTARGYERVAATLVKALREVF